MLGYRSGRWAVSQKPKLIQTFFAIYHGVLNKFDIGRLCHEEQPFTLFILFLPFRIRSMKNWQLFTYLLKYTAFLFSTGLE